MPYSEEDVPNVVQKVMSGSRPAIPLPQEDHKDLSTGQGVPFAVAKIVEACWAHDPER